MCVNVCIRVPMCQRMRVNRFVSKRRRIRFDRSSWQNAKPPKILPTDPTAWTIELFISPIFCNFVTRTETTTGTKKKRRRENLSACLFFSPSATTDVINFCCSFFLSFLFYLLNECGTARSALRELCSSILSFYFVLFVCLFIYLFSEKRFCFVQRCRSAEILSWITI